jgi:hypothetical protein
MNETGSSDLPQDPAGITGELFRERGTPLPIEGAARLEVIGAIENPPDHVPFGQTQ